eukprot:TRINITY_DN109080_c0_g1_i1.p2 TRINITY_DN109080_c0_g1~~TRINITY_DN109080_c0_g1_i1.p2  ORF type:complete len:106 (-),score=15.15 TRINITY_DN109080_c0_g1_i1:22-339(-)
MMKIPVCSVTDSTNLRSKLLEEIRAKAEIDSPAEMALPVEEKGESVPEAKSSIKEPEVISAPVVHPWKSALDKLTAMGFADRLQNIKLLIAHKGDLPAVINSLLQ